MRATEFIKEDKISDLPDIAVSTINNMGVIQGVSPFYGLYRMMMLAAGYPSQDIPIASVVGDVAIAMPYTDFDKETFVACAEQMGGHMHFITPGGSHDVYDAQINSPVPQNSGIKKRKS